MLDQKNVIHMTQLCLESRDVSYIKGDLTRGLKCTVRSNPSRIDPSPWTVIKSVFVSDRTVIWSNSELVLPSLKTGLCRPMDRTRESDRGPCGTGPDRDPD
jgi:hypothetical protein